LKIDTQSLFQSILQVFLRIFGALVTGPCCSMRGAFPCSIKSTVSSRTSAPIWHIRSCSSPAVSCSPMTIFSCMIHSPVSTFSSMKKVVSPVSRSPLMTAQLMGAAPRYFGNNDACKFIVPNGGMVKTDTGNIRNATTTKRSADSSFSSAMKAWSARFVGVKMGIPQLSAVRFTGVALSFCPRPTGLSGPVTTPTSSW